MLPGNMFDVSTLKPAGGPVTAVPAVVCVRQRARHRRRELIDLRLRLHQGLVAQLQIGGDLARADRVVRDHVVAAAVRKLESSAIRRRFGRGWCCTASWRVSAPGEVKIIFDARPPPTS